MWSIFTTKLTINQRMHPVTPITSTCVTSANHISHYNDVIMNTMASQFTCLTIIYSIVYSGTYQRKHQSSASLALVMGIHRWPVNSPHKGPVSRKKFPFDDVIMIKECTQWHRSHQLALRRQIIFHKSGHGYCLSARILVLSTCCHLNKPFIDGWYFNHYKPMHWYGIKIWQW